MFNSNQRQELQDLKNIFFKVKIFSIFLSKISSFGYNTTNKEKTSLGGEYIR